MLVFGLSITQFTGVGLVFHAWTGRHYAVHHTATVSVGGAAGIHQFYGYGNDGGNGYVCIRRTDNGGLLFLVLSCVK